MNELLYKSKDDAPIKGKPKVYFTCHPDDMSESFEIICEDIFADHNCVIFYRRDMSEALPEGSETDLEAMNLFVYPVTGKLLAEHCTAIDTELPFALSQGIRILPVVVEEGAGDLPGYNLHFGSLQYLDRTLTDTTGVPYKKKLKDFLDRVLLDDATMEQIRREFDAYIFLSYRKKDRKLANELMRRIHDNRTFLSIAIWYDEYLVPGESFDQSIQEAMDKSKLFMLLVTPSLLERNELDEMNYVQRVEYPRAREAEMPIVPVEPVLPIEVIAVSRELLEKNYQGIPEIIVCDDEKRLFKVLSDHIGNYIRNISDCSERFYLLGMTYLNGYDVEIHRELGIELLSIAGEAGDIRAIEQLFDIYSYKGYNSRSALRSKYSANAMYWLKKKLEYSTKTFGESDEKTLRLMYEVALNDESLGNGQKRDMLEKCMKLASGVMREDDIFMLDLRRKLITMTCETPAERYRESERLFFLAYKRYGREKNERGVSIAAGYDRFASVNTLSHIPAKLRGEILRETYENRCRELGKDHRKTLWILKLIERNEAGKPGLGAAPQKSSGACMTAEETDRCFEEYQRERDATNYGKAGFLLAKILRACAEQEDHLRRRRILEDVCEDEGRRFSDEEMPPDAQSHLHELAAVCARLGDLREAVRLTERYYEITKKQEGDSRGKGEFIGLETERELAELYRLAGDFEKEAGMLAELLRVRIPQVRKIRVASDVSQYEKTRRFDVNSIAEQLFANCCKRRDLSIATGLAEEHPVILELLKSYAGFLESKGQSEDAELIRGTVAF